MRNDLSKMVLIFYIFSSEPLVTAQHPLTVSDLGYVAHLTYKMVTVIVSAPSVAMKLKGLSIYKVPRTVPGLGQT